tara:strand:- start:382 stop:1128 length:747 start_codon:yes stop_codon:yes gene_type:complete
MNYKIIYFLVIAFFLYSCETTSSKKNIKIKFENKYKNIGFALIYNEKLDDIKKIDQRSLNIYHKTLRKRSLVKITNPKNGKSLLAEVKSNNVKFSNFYNSVLSSRIAETLELDFNEPYIEIIAITKNSTFVAKKSKTFDEERSVAEKAPIDGIQINDLNLKKTKKKENKKSFFSYSIKVADFYYRETANLMVQRIKEETKLKNLSIIKLSATNFRVLIGPFNDIKSLKDSFEKMNSLNFENLEILKNV